MNHPSASASRHLRLVASEEDQSTVDYLEQWLSSRRSLRPSTRRSYEGHIRLHIAPRIGSRPLSRLTRRDLEEMFDDLLSPASRIGQATVLRVFATLSSALNHAVSAGMIDANPAALVELPKPDRERPEPWSASELQLFLRHCSTDTDYPLFALLALRGLRRGEALGLTWSDVDARAGTLRIRRQLVVRDGGSSLERPKSRAGLRTIALDSRLRAILHLRGCQQRLDALLGGWSRAPETLVFTSGDGDPRNPTQVLRHFQTLAREAGLRPIRLHDLRHTSASLGLASGETLLEVSRRLGHSSLAITADAYSEVMPETAATSAHRLAQHVLGDE
ncbi:tyrosine-type recombinase/integrase [Aeromicrobium sp.]|uniref:tyrosine-type recombinase/integrase n=1 Tax=Aeromicrobium sp. TaxID=1871063 RepID=UPI004033FA01